MAEASSFSILEKGNLSSEDVGFFSQIADFGRGVIKGGVEDPVNGLIQLSNKIVGTELSELHLVDAEKANRSVGGLLGNMAGKAIDFALIAMATKNLAVPSTTSGAIVRSGSIGAIYGGILTPSNPNSESFLWDRARNGAITFGTFAAMGAAGVGIDKTGVFNVAEGRSLLGSMSYSGLTGAAGGIANAEMNAILYQGRPLPTVDNFVTDVLSWAAFGVVSGSVGYGFNQYNARHINIETTPGQAGVKGSVSVQLDSSGRPVKVSQFLEGGDFGAYRWDSKLKTNGTWHDTGSGAYNTPVLTGIKIEPNGTVVTRDGWYNNRYYQQGARFDSDRGRARDLAEAFARAGAPTTSTVWNNAYESRALDHIKLTKTGWIELDQKTGAIVQTVRTDNNLGQRTYDSAGRLLAAVPDWEAGLGRSYGTIHWRTNGSGKNVTRFSYANNNLSEVTVNDLNASRVGAANQWAFFEGRSKYTVAGQFEMINRTNPNGIEQLRFVNKNGVATQIAASDHVALKNILQSNAVLEPGATGFNYIKVNNEGIPTLYKNGISRITLNDKVLEAGSQNVLKPGDKIQITTDVGDRYPVWQTLDFQWIKDATKNAIGKYAIVPGKAFDILT